MTTTTTTTVTDLYPSRGATEVSVPRQDPVVWSAPGTPGRSQSPASRRTSATASSRSRS